MKRCSAHKHAAGCRPARPLCRWQRKVQEAKYGPCSCPAYHFPHRRGSCSAALEKTAADSERYRSERDNEAFAFFDRLAAEAGVR